MLEQLPARDADDAGLDAVLGELLVGPDAERDLRAGRHQEDVRLAVGGVGQDVGPLVQALGRGVLAAVEGRQGLAGEDQGHRLVVQLHDVPPRLGDLVRVRRAERDQARDRPQRRELLDRLVGRAVLADADRVVREDEDDRDFHERRQSNRRPHVVGEDQEARAERPDLRQGHPVEDGSHRVLADAEVHIPAAVAVGGEVAGALEGEPGLGRGGQVGRAAHEPGDVLRDRVLHLRRGVAARDALGVGREDRDVLVPALRQVAVLHQLELLGQLGILRLVGLDLLEPGVAGLFPTLADAVLIVLVDAVGDEELGVLRPAVIPLCELDLFLAERLAVGGVGVLLVGRTPGDVAVDDDQRRPIIRLLEDLQGPVQHRRVVGVAHAGDVPAVADEPGGDVLAEGQLGVAFDGDLVVVVDPAEVRQLEVRGQRGGLAGDALHHATVAADGVDVVVE